MKPLKKNLLNCVSYVGSDIVKLVTILVLKRIIIMGEGRCL